MRRNILLVVVGVILLFNCDANASIMPDLSLAIYPVAGEAELINGGNTVYIDWIVDYRGRYNEYFYMYQVENVLVAGSVIDKFYIQPILGNIFEWGWAQQPGAAGHTVDLDSQLALEVDFNYNHDDSDSHFLYLSGEHENASASIESVYSADATGQKMEWNFKGGTLDGIDSGNESDGLWFASLQPPIYTPAYATGTYTLNGSVPAPAAVPEPASLSLLGLGLFGLAGFRRKKV